MPPVIGPALQTGILSKRLERRAELLIQVETDRNSEKGKLKVMERVEW